jgi:hypothetical protein
MELRHGRARKRTSGSGSGAITRPSSCAFGLRDILGLADYEQNFIELTALADACLQLRPRVRRSRSTVEMVAARRDRPRQNSADRSSTTAPISTSSLWRTRRRRSNYPSSGNSRRGVWTCSRPRPSWVSRLSPHARLRPDGEERPAGEYAVGLRGLLPSAGATLGNSGARPHAAHCR